MAEPTLAASSKTAGGDFIVAGCRLATSALTALILLWIDLKFGFALYTWTVWFVIPVGAILAGFAGASGYYAGSWWFGRRPTRLLLQNVVLASVASCGSSRPTARRTATEREIVSEQFTTMLLVV